MGFKIMLQHHAKKRTLLIVIFLVLTCFYLGSCGGSGGGGSTDGALGQKVPEHLKGQWLPVHGGEDVYLGDSTPYTIEELDDNLILLKDEKRGTAQIATRYGSQESTVTLTVAKHSESGAKGISGIMGLETILQSLKDKANRHVAQTDINGRVSVDGLPSGDYSVTIAGHDNYLPTQLEFQLNDFKDLAVITPSVKGSYSFKTNYAGDQEFVFGDYATYTGLISITNIGVKDADSPSYRLSVDNGSHILLMDSDDTNLEDTIKGTIEPERTRYIKVRFRTRFLADTGTSGDYFDDKINVLVTDMYGKQWVDYVPIRIYRRAVLLNTENNSNNNLNGVLVFPDRHLKRLSTLKTLKIPRSTGMPYSLVITNIEANTEKTYSLGLETPSHSKNDMVSFLETGKDELGVAGNATGNDTESTAVVLKTGERYMSYIGKNDMDWYQLDMSESSSEPVDLIVDQNSVFYSVHDTESDIIKGNKDKKINPGETVRLNLAITNKGTSTAYDVHTLLSLSPETLDEGFVTISESGNSSDDNPYSIGDIAGGSTEDCNGRDSKTSSLFLDFNGDFILQVNPSTPVGYQIGLVATIRDAYNHEWICPFTLTVQTNDAYLRYYPPSANHKPIQDVNIDGTCPSCNNDGIINPGENIRLNIAIQNSGSSQANRVNATLSLKQPNHPGVTITQAESGYSKMYSPFVLAGEVVSCNGVSEGSPIFLSGNSGNYRIEFLHDAPPGLVDFILTMTDEFSNTWTDQFQLEIVPPSKK